MERGFLYCIITPDGHNHTLSVVLVQHKKLSVEGGGISKDFRKGQKEGTLEMWDPVDQVLSGVSEGQQLQFNPYFTQFSQQFGNTYILNMYLLYTLLLILMNK